MKPFLVTGFGRSGTKWLARELNKSPTWTVRHEPKRPATKDYHGDVNGYWRNQIPSPNHRVTAVIYRDPYEIARSAWHKPRSVPLDWEKFCAELAAWQRLYGSAMNEFAGNSLMLTISFSLVICSPTYLQTVAQSLGITDLNTRKTNFTPCNSSPPGELPEKAKTQLRKALENR